MDDDGQLTPEENRSLIMDALYEIAQDLNPGAAAEPPVEGKIVDLFRHLSIALGLDPEDEM